MIRRRATRLAGLLAASAVALALAGCGSSDDGASGADNDEPTVDPSVVLKAHDDVDQLLPDEAAMPSGWTLEGDPVILECEWAPADACPSYMGSGPKNKVLGVSTFNGPEGSLRLQVTTFGSAEAAEDTYQTVLDAATETPNGTLDDSAPTVGEESFAITAEGGGNGGQEAFRLGTVLGIVYMSDTADVDLMNDATDMLSQRAAQALSGETVDAAVS